MGQMSQFQPKVDANHPFDGPNTILPENHLILNIPLITTLLFCAICLTLTFHSTKRRWNFPEITKRREQFVLVGPKNRLLSIIGYPFRMIPKTSYFVAPLCPLHHSLHASRRPKVPPKGSSLGPLLSLVSFGKNVELLSKLKGSMPIIAKSSHDPLSATFNGQDYK